VSIILAGQDEMRREEQTMGATKRYCLANTSLKM
jgi:hypothetical protein